MTRAQIIHVQTRIGTTPDGFWGPQSIAACQRHLLNLFPAAANRFPKQGSAAFNTLYGRHGEPGGFSPPTTQIELPFPIYYEGNAVRRLRPHRECAASLGRVFGHLAAAFPTEAERRAAGILTYDGLYAPRSMRGGTAWSMHSWAIAIDFNAARNGNRTAWPVVATMPLEVMECFAREGWTAAGAFWGRDAMHFQATTP